MSSVLERQKTKAQTAEHKKIKTAMNLPKRFTSYGDSAGDFLMRVLVDALAHFLARLEIRHVLAR